MVIIPGVEVDNRPLAGICDRSGIAGLQVFGSQPHRTAGPDSDIDVLYTLRPGRRPGWQIGQLADEFTELSGRRADLVSPRCLAVEFTRRATPVQSAGIAALRPGLGCRISLRLRKPCHSTTIVIDRYFGGGHVPC